MWFTSVAITVNCFITDALQTHNFFPQMSRDWNICKSQFFLLNKIKHFWLVNWNQHNLLNSSVINDVFQNNRFFVYIYNTGKTYIYLNFFVEFVLCLKDKGVHVIHYWYLTLSLSIAVLMYTPNY